MQKRRFLEAGSVHIATTVRPKIAATAKKGLSQVEADSDDVFETSDGQASACASCTFATVAALIDVLRPHSDTTSRRSPVAAARAGGMK